MCRGTFGCPIRVVEYVMSVIRNSLCLTEDTIAGFAVEFFVQSVLIIGFLLDLVIIISSMKSRKRLGRVITASSNGIKAD